MLPNTFSLTRAGRWFLESGIQEPSGGVARFYRSEVCQNKPVSTEITGYTASALAYLYEATGNAEYLDRARHTARFLTERAWDPNLSTFPFEYPSPSSVSDHRTFFFDCGIIIRGLLAVWRFTKEDQLLDLARTASLAMVTDFDAGSDFWPILELPSKQPLDRTTHWSRSSGCYQLKSALAWYDVAQITGDDCLSSAWSKLLEASIKGYQTFLPAQTPHQTMDRLHATSYFLEALSPVLDRPDCAGAFRQTLGTVSGYLHEIAPSFARSDVYAQLLRARINGASVVPLDSTLAAIEAEALTSFQAESPDVRIDGSFLFGRRDGQLSPHVNPVSTAFALQALEMWHGWQAGKQPPCRSLMI